jgi:putative transposase
MVSDGIPRIPTTRRHSFVAVACSSIYFKYAYFLPTGHEMIRRSQLTLKYINKGKYTSLDSVMKESVRVVNLFIDLLWENGSKKFVTEKVDTWLSARMQQCLGKQALEIIKSQRKKHPDKRTKPQLRSESLTLDERFLDIRTESNGFFDIWLRLGSIGNKMTLKLPSKKHTHFNDLISRSWDLKKSCRLRRVNGVFYIDLFFHKEVPVKKGAGESIGFDCGYKKLLADSNGTIHDCGLEASYEKIARKKQGSKGFKNALRHRDNLINQTINSIDLSSVKDVIVEALKHVKTGSRKKKRIRKSFMNKLQRWSYPKVLDKIHRRCEEEGINYIEINPAYTSQKCSKCGVVDRKSRNGQKYQCTTCSMEMDADHNAAINILRLGAYSPHAA